MITDCHQDSKNQTVQDENENRETWSEQAGQRKHLNNPALAKDSACHVSP